MAKCLDCGIAYCVYGGSAGSKCPTCGSRNIDISKEGRILNSIKVKQSNQEQFEENER